MIEGNIIDIQYSDNVTIESDDLFEINSISLKFVKKSPYAVLLEPGIFTTFSSEARELGASNKLEGNRVATALLGNSLSYKLIGNFYLKSNKPVSPTKMFETRDAALDWLKKSMNAVAETK